MTTSPRSKGRLVVLVLAFVLVAANMRPSITAVGPVLEDIAASTGIPVAALGMLTSVPLVTWALVSPAAHDVSRRFGISRAMVGALVLLGIGTLVRAVPDVTATLWLGTALIGIAVAIGNVLMPAAVKRDFPTRVPLMMAVYSATLGGSGALASGLVVPLANGAGMGWNAALLTVSAAAVPLALVAWTVATAREPRAAASARRVPRGAIWRDRTAWLVGCYMGFQSMSFFVLVTWIAPIATSYGATAEAAGGDVMLFQLFGLVGSLGLPFLLRGRVERFAPAALPVLGVVGAVGVLVAPGALGAWIAVLGLFTGASLSMALTLMAVRARTTDHATALSGMAQSTGYAITAVGPAAFGALHGLTGDWTLPLGFLLTMMLVQAAVGLFAGRDRFVLDGH